MFKIIPDTMENLWKSIHIKHQQAYTHTYKYKEEGGYNIAFPP